MSGPPLLLALLVTGCTPKAEDSGALVDSAPLPEDTGTPTPTDPTPVEIDCGDPVVVFEPDVGAAETLTPSFLDGTPVTLDTPGILHVCPGKWTVHLTVAASVDLRVYDDDPATTTLTGDGTGRVLDVTSGASLSGRTFSVIEGATAEGGGGLRCTEATVVMESVWFVDNEAAEGAGLSATDCETSLHQVNFGANLASGAGGAVRIEGGHASFEQVRIQGNFGGDGAGMAIVDADGDFLEAWFEANVGQGDGAGVWASGSDLTFTLSNFVANAAPKGFGGGFHGDGYTFLDRTNFTDHNATSGGGLYLLPDATLQATACNFATNNPEDVFQDNSSGGVAYTAGTGKTFTCELGACFGI